MADGFRIAVDDPGDLVFRDDPAPVIVDRTKRKAPAWKPFRVGNEIAQTPEQSVYVLTRYLAGQCDGARVRDGHGFNRVHAVLGHKLAEMAFEEWTPRQLWAARNILTTYSKRQLAEWWARVPTIPEPGNRRRSDSVRTATRTTSASRGERPSPSSPTARCCSRSTTGTRWSSCGKTTTPA